MAAASPSPDPGRVEFTLNGRAVSIARDQSLLDGLREELAVTSVKDGCSPQGQCGCCTVWVDGAPRVSCVTPAGRVANRTVTTLEGLDGAGAWAQTFCERGASQCGFCTPGIIMRAAAMSEAERAEPVAVRRALLAHLCRCTGWQPIIEAIVAHGHRIEAEPVTGSTGITGITEAARRRAEIEGGVPQRLGPAVALGEGGFADDTAPRHGLVGLRRPIPVDAGAADPGVEPTGGPAGDPRWVLESDLAAARAAAGKVQGRRTTAAVSWPLEPPAGDWDRMLCTTWVEPAALETDTSWCAPGGQPASPLANGGAFGAKSDSPLGAEARRLADATGEVVRVRWSREDTVRYGPKRPPVAIGMNADGSGVMHVVRTPGVVEAVARWAPGMRVVEFDVPGPPTSLALRGAVWAELAAVSSSFLDGPDDVAVTVEGGRARARLDEDGRVVIGVSCGVDPEDERELAVLGSYCTGAAHMALGWVRSEAIAVDDDGEPHDLTIRSFGILRAVDTPEIVVEIDAEIDAEIDPGPLGGSIPGGRVQVNGSDAVFAAVAAAAWRATGWVSHWPLLSSP